MDSLYSGMSVGFGFLLFFTLLSFVLILFQNYRKRILPQNKSINIVDLAEYQVDERKGLRVKIKWPVTVETLKGKIKAETKDINQIGAFITCSKPLTLGEQFRLIIETPSNCFISLKSEVIWSNANISEDKIVIRGMGIRFIQNTETDLEFLKAALEECIEPENRSSVRTTVQRIAFI